MKKNKSKAFTLVELMIVISIIGVLAVTLLPKLQGAQARSRDAGRIASLTNVEAVLNTYYGDEGSYPLKPVDGTTAHAGCLSTNDGSVQTNLANLFKGGKAPIDTQSKIESAGCSTKRSLAYFPLTKDGIEGNSYLLITDVEAFKKANYTVNSTTTNGPASNDGTTTFTNIKSGTKGIWGTPTTEDTTSAKKTVYAAIN